MKTITTVAGVIVNENGEILCTKRDVGKYEYTSLKWEFPGGKIEAGETQEEALERELREELEIKVDIKNLFYQVEHDYPDFHLSMGVFECEFHKQHISMNVHKDLKWVKPEDLMKLEWAKADLPVAQKIYDNAQKEQTI